MNLLDFFALRHTQLTSLHAELHEQSNIEQRIQAKVELNLSPREMKVQGDVGNMPTYQIACTLTCNGESEESKKTVFTVQVGVQVAYQQIDSETVGFEDFKKHHSSLTRQLYPLLYQHMRNVMLQLGLEHVRLPYDLINQKPVEMEGRSLH